jgi:hypothetical protein
MTESHTGSCFCGAVVIEVTGVPETMGYCHCDSCRTWSAAPVNAFTLWKPENVRVAAGAQFLGRFQKAPGSIRRFCRNCGGHVMADHPGLGLVDVFAATIPTVCFAPALHLHYAERVLPIADGLPKLRDAPFEFGGSGEMTAE